eukprot:scaffold165692_cov37-Tisochrysis_lutea.AAC.3
MHTGSHSDTGRLVCYQMRREPTWSPMVSKGEISLAPTATGIFDGGNHSHGACRQHLGASLLLLCSANPVGSLARGLHYMLLHMYIWPLPALYLSIPDVNVNSPSGPGPQTQYMPSIGPMMTNDRHRRHASAQGGPKSR